MSVLTERRGGSILIRRSLDGCDLETAMPMKPGD
jgi:hypothetical protein